MSMYVYEDIIINFNKTAFASYLINEINKREKLLKHYLSQIIKAKDAVTKM